MKVLLTSIFLLVNIANFTQTRGNKYVGHYHSELNGDIILNQDSTFKYTYAYDLFFSWSKGKWTVKKDTIYLMTILVCDTLRYRNANGKLVDSLVLADEEKPKLVTQLSNVINNISSEGQNRERCPTKLFYTNNKLYGIDRYGKLIKKKQRGFWVNKKLDPMYFKQLDK